MKRNYTALTVYIMLPVLMIISAAFGAADIDFITVIKAVLYRAGIGNFELSGTVDLILFSIRFPRILLAAFTGAGLATAGTVFQAVFQNPLAEPYLLGVSSGASLGATAGIILGTGMLLGGIGSITVFAFIGAMLTIFLVLMISGRAKGDFSGLLLGGIAIGYIFQAVISFLMMMHKDQMEQIVFWMMGSFTAANWDKVQISAIVVVFCIVIININAVKLNLLSLGSDEAHSLGIDPEKTGIFFLIISCLLTAAVVSVSGIIGFVGLIVPHLLRIFTGADHRRLLPVSAAGGACLMIAADIAARTMMAPKEIPVGVITALIGGPFFLAMLRKKRKEAAGWR